MNLLDCSFILSFTWNILKCFPCLLVNLPTSFVCHDTQFLGIFFQNPKLFLNGENDFAWNILWWYSCFWVTMLWWTTAVLIAVNCVIIARSPCLEIYHTLCVPPLFAHVPPPHFWIHCISLNRPLCSCPSELPCANVQGTLSSRSEQTFNRAWNRCPSLRWTQWLKITGSFMQQQW